MRAAAVAAVALTAGLVVPEMARGQSLSTVTLARQAQGEPDLRVDVEFAAGKVTVTPGDLATLYHARIVYDENRVTPATAYDPQSRRLRIDVGKGSITEGEWKGHELALALSPAVPTRLDLQLGAAEATMDLGGLAITRASVASGASQSTIDFSQPNRVTCDRLEIKSGAAELDAVRLGNARCRRIEVAGGVADLTLDLTGAWDPAIATRMSLKLGLGEVTLRVPRDLGISVDLTRLLVSFERAGLTKRGSRYYSEDFDAAAAKLFIDIDAAFGEVRLVWVEP